MPTLPREPGHKAVELFQAVERGDIQPQPLDQPRIALAAGQRRIPQPREQPHPVGGPRTNECQTEDSLTQSITPLRASRARWWLDINPNLTPTP